jgi:hypothetical protein
METWGWSDGRVYDEERVEENEVVRHRLPILLQSSTIAPDWRLKVPAWFEAEFRPANLLSRFGRERS